jgi:hypothetical protein
VRRLALALVALAVLLPGTAHASHRSRNDSTAWLNTPVRKQRPRPLARLQVVAREFDLTVSRKRLPAGRVSVELDNLGEDPHDLRVERARRSATGFSFDLARSHTVSTRRLTLGPGSWKLYCTLPGHAALGMSATVTVR